MSTAARQSPFSVSSSSINCLECQSDSFLMQENPRQRVVWLLAWFSDLLNLMGYLMQNPLSVCRSLSLSLSIYIYVYIYIWKKINIYVHINPNNIPNKSHDIIFKTNADLQIKRPTLSRYIGFSYFFFF